MNTLSNNASLAQEIESIVSKYKTYEQTYILKNPEVMRKISNNEAFLQQSIDQYQYILLAMFGKATAMLTRIRGDNDELHLKLIEAQNLIELRSIDINNLQFQINKLKEKQQRMMKNEQELKYEIQRLNAVLLQKNRNLEESQTEFQEIQQQLQSSNKYLTKQNTELTSKIEECQAAINQATCKDDGMQVKNQVLQADLCKYINFQDNIEDTLVHIKEQYRQVTEFLYQQIQEKQDKIDQLGEVITQKNEEAVQQQKIEKTDSLGSFSDKKSSIASPRNFSQLCQQLNLKSKTLIPLESVTENKLRQEQLDQSMTSSVEEFINGSLRKASSVRNQHHSLEDCEENSKSCEGLQSPAQSTESIQTKKYRVTDKKIEPQYMHYLLLVQTVKLEEDEDDTHDMLDIEMKPYFNQLKESGIKMVDWPEWIKNKLISLVN